MRCSSEASCSAAIIDFATTRRRLFVAGIIVFTLASLVSGLAWAEASLIEARALRGSAPR